MGSKSKLQSYPYSLRTVCATEEVAGLICGNRFFMYMLPPKGALTIERLHCHFVFRFASSIDSSLRSIQSIGIVDELVPLFGTDSNYQKRQTLNIQADSDRRIDVSIDLSHLLKKDNVAYKEQIFDEGPDDGYTAVEIQLNAAINPEAETGVVELWKQDGLFTTIGIR